MRDLAVEQLKIPTSKEINNSPVTHWISPTPLYKAPHLYRRWSTQHAHHNHCLVCDPYNLYYHCNMHMSQDHNHPWRLCKTLLECATRHTTWLPDMEVMTYRMSLPPKTHLHWILHHQNPLCQRKTNHLMNTVRKLTLTPFGVAIRTVLPT